MRVRVISLIVIVAGFFISFGLAKNLYTAYQNSKTLSDEQGKLTGLMEENSRLKNEVSQASSPNFIDDQARKKLGLVKPGEVEVVIPNQSQVATASAQIEGHNTTRILATESKLAIWKQWWEFLFGG